MSRLTNLLGDKPKFSPAPTLYFADPNRGISEFFPSDSNAVRRLVLQMAAEPNLVIITHGWLERELWPRDLALAIKAKADPNQWLCGWFDWRKQSMLINPTDAAKFGKNTAGPLLGQKILKNSEDPTHIHLIGHSAGSWVISEAAKIIAARTNATIHLTFLDAYVPPFWHQENLGDIRSDPNNSVWAEHYFTRDITLGFTEKLLTGAHNIDLTNIEPGLNDHRFPFHWYHATVLAEYATAKRYRGKELFNRAGDIEYGFARSLEAGVRNWNLSITLKPADKAVKIKPVK